MDAHEEGWSIAGVVSWDAFRRVAESKGPGRVNLDCNVPDPTPLVRDSAFDGPEANAGVTDPFTIGKPGGRAGPDRGRGGCLSGVGSRGHCAVCWQQRNCMLLWTDQSRVYLSIT